MTSEREKVTPNLLRFLSIYVSLSLSESLSLSLSLYLSLRLAGFSHRYATVVTDLQGLDELFKCPVFKCNDTTYVTAVPIRDPVKRIDCNCGDGGFSLSARHCKVLKSQPQLLKTWIWNIRFARISGFTNHQHLDALTLQLLENSILYFVQISNRKSNFKEVGVDNIDNPARAPSLSLQMNTCWFSGSWG